MAVPWLQIVQLVPSIVEVSRELLKKTKSTEPVAPAEATRETLLARIAALEENERKQAELVSTMADQLAALARATTVLHRRVIWLTVGCGASIVLALAALLIAGGAFR